MDKSISVFKSAVPQILRQCADWFEVDVTIKLFGVKVFSFTWPPKQNVESQNLE